LGLRVRKARIKAGLSQEQAAHQVERSDRWLLKVENGQADPCYGDLVRLAPVLNVEFEQLVLDRSTGRPTNAWNSRDPAMMTDSDGYPTDARLDALRRRGFLQAGLVVAGGIVLGLWPAMEDDAESQTMVALRRTLLDYGPGTVSERPDVVALRTAVRAAWADRQESRYSCVLEAVPSLLGQVRAAIQELDGLEREEGLYLLTQTYRLIFDLLRKVGDHQLAAIAADRAMLAAQQHGHPAVIANATGCLRAALSAGRHHALAIELATTAASNLEQVAVHGGELEHLSTYGNILLAGAEAAAQAGDRALSDDFYRDADGVARLLGRDANHSFTAFGPTNITVHRTHAAVVLGDGERAVRLAKDLDLTRLPVRERRAHHLMDVAIAHSLVENTESAITTLLTAEEVAAEEIRLDPGARALVFELGRRGQRQSSQLESLAERMRVSA
jgi:transcriptional regulator with XRE-family HTH domain